MPIRVLVNSLGFLFSAHPESKPLCLWTGPSLRSVTDFVALWTRPRRLEYNLHHAAQSLNLVASFFLLPPTSMVAFERQVEVRMLCVTPALQTSSWSVFSEPFDGPCMAEGCVRTSSKPSLSRPCLASLLRGV